VAGFVAESGERVCRIAHFGDFCGGNERIGELPRLGITLWGMAVGAFGGWWWKTNGGII
jgi:hypothetical protein